MSTLARYPVPVPGPPHRVEQSIDRSRFVCSVARASTPDEAQAFVRAMSLEFGDATHNCWAFVAGAPGSTAQVGMSDDGEPHGTAGRPMLTVLLHSGVGEIVAVVTRYYGGIKLGTGGLARAYASSVQLALATLPRAERVDWRELSIVAGYPSVSALKLLFPQCEAEVIDEAFGADVRFRVRLPAPQVEALRRAVGDATRGQAIVLGPGDGA